jgi:ribonuclease D
VPVNRICGTGEPDLKTEGPPKTQKALLFETDLPDDIFQRYMAKAIIAIDTETRGLKIPRDRLCLIQLCDDDGLVAFVRFNQGQAAPNLKKLLESPKVVKLFHFGRFDIAVLKHYMNVDVTPVFCTKIASKLVRTYTDRHGLKDLVFEILGIELDKTNQSSDWARRDLSESQIEYAANDVRVLIPLYEKMKALLEREKLTDLAQRLFDFLPTVCELDLRGWNADIFDH